MPQDLYGEAVESKFTKAEWDEVVAILEQKRSADAAAAAAAAAAAIAADAGAQIKND